MSHEAAAIALHHSRARGTARLVLLGIANHDGDGGSWPSLATLAKYAGGVHQRNISAALARLEQLGEIRRQLNAGGTASTPNDQRPTLYHFLLTCPPTCDGSKNHRDRTAAQLPTFGRDDEISTPPQGMTKSAPPGMTKSAPKPVHLTTSKTSSAAVSTRASATPCSARAAGQPHKLSHGRLCIYCGHVIEASA